MDTIERTQEVQIGTEIYPITSDDTYLEYISTNFEPEMCEFFKLSLKKEHTVLDIGANIGCASLLFSNHVQQVHSFEPSPSTYKFLEKNVQQAKKSNISTYNLGLGSEDKIAEIAFSSNNRSGGFITDLSEAHSHQVKEKVAIKKIDTLVEEYKFRSVDFIKIDAEGYEKNILEGGINTIANYKPTVVLELNHWCLNAFQRITIPDFLDYLLNLFPYIFAFDHQSGKLADLRNKNHRYVVTYQHIINFHWMTLMGAFSQEQLSDCLSKYPLLD